MPGPNAGETLVVPAGTISVAPLATAAPADEVAALNAGFVDLGYTTEDGFTFRYNEDKGEVRAWQSGYRIRSIVNQRNAELAFVLEQWNKESMRLAFGGGTFTTVTAGHFKFTPPGINDAIYQRELVVSFNDGAKHYRIVVPKAEVTDQVETQLQRGQQSNLPLTLTVIGADVGDPWYGLSDDPSWG